MTQPQKCSHTTRSGQPCRAWAIRGSDPPTCSAHAGRLKGRAGAPPGNQNARTHGFYAPVAPDDQDLLRFEDASLQSEILIARQLLMRLLYFLDGHTEEELDGATLTRVAGLAFQALRTIARLLRDHRTLAPSQSSLFQDAINNALDELSEEWGIEL